MILSEKVTLGIKSFLLSLHTDSTGITLGIMGVFGVTQSTYDFIWLFDDCTIILFDDNTEIEVDNA
jgi:hypothetical protein